jgi:hypothetical protein
MGNSFAFEESKNFQRSALERHLKSDDHKLADTCRKQAEKLMLCPVMFMK